MQASLGLRPRAPICSAEESALCRACTTRTPALHPVPSHTSHISMGCTGGLVLAPAGHTDHRTLNGLSRGAPHKQNMGQMQHYEAHMCTLCCNKHKQSVGGLSCASRRGRHVRAHVPTLDTCALTRLGSLALVLMNPRLKRLPMHTVHSPHGSELKFSWKGSRL